MRWALKPVSNPPLGSTTFTQGSTDSKRAVGASWCKAHHRPLRPRMISTSKVATNKVLATQSGRTHTDRQVRGSEAAG